MYSIGDHKPFAIRLLMRHTPIGYVFSKHALLSEDICLFSINRVIICSRHEQHVMLVFYTILERHQSHVLILIVWCNAKKQCLMKCIVGDIQTALIPFSARKLKIKRFF